MASLYRRHRPRTFADVVGQEHVVRTLSNAIEQDKVHHAYLFVGSRGTGKTSMAKILAASLNCVHGPTVSPCGACDSCVSIATATSLDVIEMDAASNNSVDDIRDLREKVAYAPVAGRWKVYILDEAHMLTPAAWNAFLKTLEEPPPHTVFILATTEVQKVLPTVADRCHRFDFGRPTIGQIATVLDRAASAESIAIPDEATALVARSATGSFRDALGTLEQLVAYAGRSVTLDDVLAVLGAVDADLLLGTVTAVASGNARDALLAAARLAESGRDVGRFFADLEAHLRALMIVQTLDEVPAPLRMTADADARLADQAAAVDGATVVRLLDLLAAGLRAMKDGADARTQLELALVKAADPARDPSVKALMLRLERLERGLARPAPSAPAPVASPGAARPAAPGADTGPPVASGAAAVPAGDAGQAAAPRGDAGRSAAPGGDAGPPATSDGHAAPRPAPPAFEMPVVPARPPNAPPSSPRAPEQPATAAAQAARQAHAAAAEAPPAPGGASAAAPGPSAAPADRDDDRPPPHTEDDVPAGLDRPYGEPPAAGGWAPPPRPDVPTGGGSDAWPPAPAATPAAPSAPAATPAAPSAPAATPAAAAPPPEAVTLGDPDARVAVAAAALPGQAQDGVAVAVAPVAGSLDLDAVRELWPAVLEQLSGTHLGAFLAEAQPVALDDDRLTVAFSESAAIFMKTADKAGNREVIAGAVRSVTGQALRLAYELRADDDLTVAGSLTAPVPEDELIDRLIDEFGATILEDAPPEETQP